MESVEDKAERDRRELSNRDMNDVRMVVSTPEGRRWYWKAMSEAGTFKMSFTGKAAFSDFNEGKRAMGNNFFHDLMSAKPEAFLQMQRENAALVNQSARAKSQEEEAQ
jgi:hypothetical protein